MIAFTEPLKGIKYEDIPANQRWPNQHTGYPKLRPNVKTDQGGVRSISGLHISGMRNLGGVYVDFSFNHSNDEPPLTFAEVALSNLWFEDTLRVPEENGGNHMDDINVRGGWNPAIKNILRMYKIQVDRSKSGSPAIFINEGNFELIEMDEIEVNAPQWTSAIDMKDQSWVPGKEPKFITKKIVIRRSPGFELLLQGPPGSVLEVFHEPGVVVRGSIWNGVHTGAKIYEIAPGAPAVPPQPAPGLSVEQRLEQIEKLLQSQVQVNITQQAALVNQASLIDILGRSVAMLIEDQGSLDALRINIQALDNLLKAQADRLDIFGPRIKEVEDRITATEQLIVKLRTGLIRRIAKLEKGK